MLYFKGFKIICKINVDIKLRKKSRIKTTKTKITKSFEKGYTEKRINEKS